MADRLIGAMTAGKPSIADPSTLLTLKLLKDSDPDAREKKVDDQNAGPDLKLYEELQRDEIRFLKAGINLVKRDPWLKEKMGGSLIEGGMRMANILKANVEDEHLKARLKQATYSLLEYEAARPYAIHPRVNEGAVIYNRQHDKIQYNQDRGGLLKQIWGPDNQGANIGKRAYDWQNAGTLTGADSNMFMVG